jgi:hypothetical protein
LAGVSSIIAAVAVATTFRIFLMIKARSAMDALRNFKKKLASWLWPFFFYSHFSI